MDEWQRVWLVVVSRCVFLLIFGSLNLVLRQI